MQGSFECIDELPKGWCGDCCGCCVQELTQRLYRLSCSIVRWLDSLLPKAAKDDSILLRVEKLLTPLA